MKLTIDLPDEQTTVLESQARERGLSAEEYARQLLEQDLSANSEDAAALLDEVVSIAFSERRHQT